MKFSRLQSYILRSLYGRPSGVNVYNFIMMKAVSPGAVSISINELQSKELVDLVDDRLILSEKGGAIIDENPSLLLDRAARSWREVPKEWTVPKLDPWRPYVPRQRGLKVG